MHNKKHSSGFGGTVTTMATTMCMSINNKELVTCICMYLGEKEFKHCRTVGRIID